MDFSDADVDKFAQDGFLIKEQLVSDSEVEEALSAMDRVYDGVYDRDRRPQALRRRVTPFGTSSSVRWILNPRVLDSAIWRMATNSRLGRAAARLLQTNSVSIVEDQLLDKPGSGAPVNLHQDFSYWKFSRSTAMITCWLALCDMSPDMGPVELVRGSHRWGHAPRPRNLVHGSEDEYAAVLSRLTPQRKEEEVEFDSVVVPRGGGVFFHSLTIHGSRGNGTGGLRRAMSLHWAGEECRLQRASLVDYDYPYLFAGLKDGDRLVNTFMPLVSDVRDRTVVCE